MTLGDYAIELNGIGKRYRIGDVERYRALRDVLTQAWSRRAARGPRRQEPHLWALRDVTLAIPAGAVVGIIGRNGAGKSTLLKVLARITEPTEGTGIIRGRVGSLLEVGTGFHPELTGRENVYINGGVLGMRRKEISRKFDEIVAFAEVERFIDTPVKHYSSGMQVRLAFAVAAHLEPEILLVDEVLAVGDAAFQKKCFSKVSDVARQGRTVLLVSHNLAPLQSFCDQAYLVEGGRIAASGDISAVITRYIESVGSAETTPLADVRDRRGDGRMRISELRLCGRDGEAVDPVCGAPLRLVLRYRGTPPLRNVQVAIGVYTMLGEGVLYLANDLVGVADDLQDAEGELTCELERLPLVGGSYSVNIDCTVGGILADSVSGATRLDVTEGDFFGSGRLPPRGFGSLVVPQRWSVTRP